MHSPKCPEKKKRRIEYDSSREEEYHLNIEKEEWDTLKPQEVQHRDRITYKLSGSWTHFIIQKLWKAHQIPCPFAFKYHKFLKKNDSPLIKFTGKCHECGNPIDGFIKKESPLRFPLLVVINTCDTTGLLHLTRTNLAGERRKDEQVALLINKPKRNRDETAAEDLNETGTKPPYHYSKDVASTARREALETVIGSNKYSGDKISTLIALKKDFPSIRYISIFPLVIYYWLANLITLWNDVNSSNKHFPISIDATGSVVRSTPIVNGFPSSAIFLYNITIRIKGYIFRIFQMLSNKHDNETIRDWLLAWLASGATDPKQVVVDCSYALLIAICKAINKMHYLKFLDDCHLLITKKSNSLPPCWVRRDRAHLLEACSIWSCFAKDNWPQKDLYLRIIAYALEIEDFAELNEVMLAVFIVCQSEYIDVGSECHSQFHLLEDKISNFHDTILETGSTDEHLNCQPGSCSLLNETDNADPLFDTTDKSTGTQMFVRIVVDKSCSMLTSDSLKYRSANNYWLPSIMKNLITLFYQYPSWTNVMRKSYSVYYKTSTVSTSTASEVYFKIFKRDYELVNCSLKNMLLQHIKLLEGSTKNGRFEFKLFMENLQEIKT